MQSIVQNYIIDDFSTHDAFSSPEGLSVLPEALPDHQAPAPSTRHDHALLYGFCVAVSFGR